VIQSSKSTEKNSTKRSFPRKKSSRKSTDKSPERKMTSTANSSSRNSMTQTVPNSSKATVNPLLMTKKLKSYSKTLSLSSTRESKTWKSPKTPPKNLPKKSSPLKKN
jgi:hypothetical protein